MVAACTGISGTTGRPDDQFKDIRICEKLNADVVRRLEPGERLIDNSALTPAETVDALLESCAAR